MFQTNENQTRNQRRNRNMLLTVLVIALIGLWVYWRNQSLQSSSFTTGYLLIGALFFLAAFNLRKRLTFLPQIGTAQFWMQLHIYVGWCTFAVFAFHVGWKVPNGVFETILAAVYLTVAFSGVYGLYVTKVLPKRLAAIDEEVIFEQIPMLRSRIAHQTRQLVLQACETSDVLAKYYANRLAEFFERPRKLAYLVNPSGRERRQLVAEIQAMDRYLAADERNISRQLTQLVQKKDDLDYHHAIQGRLKTWMFLHIGLTYSLLIMAVVHGVMAHAFHGGLQ